MYAANESNVSDITAVYFDDFKIVHQKRQQRHWRLWKLPNYDPFGLIIEGTRDEDETRVEQLRVSVRLFGV